MEEFTKILEGRVETLTKFQKELSSNIAEANNKLKNTEGALMEVKNLLTLYLHSTPFNKEIEEKKKL
tara:strand:- start:6020 stop:6220 length:201 start_codon:yes stop_codon:yes gene_type:complete